MAVHYFNSCDGSAPNGTRGREVPEGTKKCPMCGARVQLHERDGKHFIYIHKMAPAYRAKLIDALPEPKVTFSPAPSEYTPAGVCEYRTDEEHITTSLLHISSRYGIPHVVSIRGAKYVVASVIDDVLGNWRSNPDIHYGPGGRRGYYRVTEQLVDDLVKVSSWERRNAPERRSAREVGALALALINLL